MTMCRKNSKDNQTYDNAYSRAVDGMLAKNVVNNNRRG